MGEEMDSQQKKVVSILDIIAISACALFSVILFVEFMFVLIAGISQNTTSDIIVGAIGLFFFVLLLIIFLLKISEIRKSNEGAKRILSKVNTWITFSTCILAFCGILLVIILAATTDFKVENFLQYQSAGLFLGIILVITASHFACSIVIGTKKQIVLCEDGSEVRAKKITTRKNIVYISLTSVIAFILIVSSILFGVYSDKAPSRFTKTVVLGKTTYETWLVARYDSDINDFVDQYMIYCMAEVLVYDEWESDISARLIISVDGKESQVVVSSTEATNYNSYKFGPQESTEYKGWYVTTFYIYSEAFDASKTGEVESLKFSINQGSYHTIPSYSDDFVLWSIEKIVAFVIMISSGSTLLTIAIIWIVDDSWQKRRGQKIINDKQNTF